MKPLQSLLAGHAWHISPELMPELHAHANRQPTTISPEQRVHRPYAREYGAPAPGQSLPMVGPVFADGTPIVPQMVVIGPVAVIPVHGVLSTDLDCWDLFCGMCDYQNIQQFSEIALGLDEVKAVVYDFNTPGGSHKGSMECAAVMQRLATRGKSTVGFSNGTIASAGYLLACSLNQIITSTTAVIGSIGTVLSVEDCSEQWAQQGRRLEIFTSSPLKVTGMYGKAMTPEDRAYLNERMLQADVRFKGAVRTGRPNIAEQALDGRWFYGEFAPAMGLSDGVASCLEDVIAAVISSVS